MPGIWEQIGAAVAKNVDIEVLGEKIWDKIWVWAEPKADELVDKYTPILLEKLMALLPTIAAAAGTAVGEQITAQFHKVLGADPDIPGLSNIFDLSETIRHAINNDPNIPFQIPFLNDILKGAQQ